MPTTMRAAVFIGKGQTELREVPRPEPVPGEALSSLGVYSGHLTMPLDAISAGLADQSVLTTLCPGGKERMRRLMSVVRAKRFPFRDLVTHSFPLDRIVATYDLFGHQRHGVMKVAIRP